MYTKVIICHTSSEQDQMMTGASSGSGNKGRPVCDSAELNFFRCTLYSLYSKHWTSQKLQWLKLLYFQVVWQISKVDFQTVSRVDRGTKHVKQKCEEDLGDIINDEWIQICLNSESCSYNLRHKLLQFKAIHRMYYMPVKLNIIHSEM
jgi:hypothetical protein